MNKKKVSTFVQNYRSFINDVTISYGQQTDECWTNTHNYDELGGMGTLLLSVILNCKRQNCGLNLDSILLQIITFKYIIPLPWCFLHQQARLKLEVNLETSIKSFTTGNISFRKLGGSIFIHKLDWTKKVIGKAKQISKWQFSELKNYTSISSVGEIETRWTLEVKWSKWWQWSLQQDNEWGNYN